MGRTYRHRRAQTSSFFFFFFKKALDFCWTYTQTDTRRHPEIQLWGSPIPLSPMPNSRSASNFVKLEIGKAPRDAGGAPGPRQHPHTLGFPNPSPQSPLLQPQNGEPPTWPAGLAQGWC